MEVVNLLAADTALSRRNFDHPAVRRMERSPRLPHQAGSRLIYRKPDDDSLELVRLGSHGELGLRNGAR
jgi:mRNA interferase YafQ